MVNVQNPMLGLVLASGVAGVAIGPAGCGEVAEVDPDASQESDGGAPPDSGDVADGDTSPDAQVICDEGFTGPGCDECTVFVDGESGDSGNQGRSWDDAVSALDSGISRAAARVENEDLERCSLWVREGSYLPGENRDDSFDLAPGVHIYGGFAGFETAREERSVEQYETILSGDLDENDDPDDEDSFDDNAYHVVTATDIDPGDATLDGFTITAGHADGESSEDQHRGGGMYNENASPTLENLLFTGNKADSGGAMRNGGSSEPTLTKVTFTGNQAESLGGAMFNTDDSEPTLTNVTFTGNQASSGGAMQNSLDSAPTLTNVIFTDNEAGAGGAMNNSFGSEPTLTNVTFTDNEAGLDGGAMTNRNDSAPTLTNVTFTDNEAGLNGGAIRILGNAEVEIFNSILWDNQADDEGDEIHHTGELLVIRNALIQGGEDDIAGGGNVDARSDDILDDADPAFEGAPDDLRLGEDSDAIDAGDVTLYDDLDMDVPDTDLAGNPRVVGDDIDLGAFEFQE